MPVFAANRLNYAAFSSTLIELCRFQLLESWSHLNRLHRIETTDFLENQRVTNALKHVPKNLTRPHHRARDFVLR